MDDIIISKEYVLEPHHLCLPIEGIAENFTLMDFFNLVKTSSAKYPWLLDVLGYPTWIEDLYDEILKDPSEFDNHAENIAYLIMSPYLSDEFDDNMEDVYRVSSVGDIYGVGKEHECGEHYGISGCRVNDLKHLKIKFDPILRKRLVYHPTVLQFIDSILWELTFFGGPLERDDKMEDLRKTSEGIKDGTIKTYPWNPPEDCNPAISYLKLGLGFLESGQIDMDAANLFLKEDKKFQEFRQRLNEVINGLKEMVSDNEDTLDDLLI